MMRSRPQSTLTCVELVELVTDYLEDVLPRRDRRRFEQHIEACVNCRTYVEQFRQTIELTGTLRESDVSPEAAAELLTQFAEWHRTRSP
jgi:anti-sigma factor RsiW